MKRKHKQYSKPKRPFDKTRIDEEAALIKEYGLKNKKEIWKADAKIKSMREKAKKLVRASEEEKQKLFDKLQSIGLKVNSLAEVLSLDVRNYLERRLQTVLFRKNLVNTMKTARQLITHKKVLVDEKVVNVPSYVVPVALEDKIKLKISAKKMEKVAKEVKEEKKKIEPIEEPKKEEKTNE
jgi:small subunit ribosomal protein S4